METPDIPQTSIVIAEIYVSVVALKIGSDAIT
jgi:hypothetical protein